MLTGRAKIVGVALLLSYAYFYQAGGWNQNSRFALVRAIIERHTLQIDAYQEHTGDRALWRGHYYSDKAPGASFVAIAPVAIARGVSRAFGVDPESFPGIAWTSYVATVATSGCFTALAALAIFWALRRWGYSEGAALFAMLGYGLAGPAWCYATLFMGHGLTAGCLMLAFSASLTIGPRPLTFRLGWAIGLLGGLAVMTEFPAAIPVALIALLAVLNAREAGQGQAISVAARIVAGGALVAALLLTYNVLAFGSPFHLGYGHEDNVEGLAMQSGIFGISYPTFHAAYEVFLGQYRGLLPLSPLVALTPVGLVLLARAPATRRPALTAAAVAGFYILLNVSYTYWEGGWAYAPRHLTPGLPFVALGLGPLWDRARRTGRILLVGCWFWGSALTLIAVSTTPQPPSNIMAPVTELLWPAFRDGDLSINNQTFVHHGADIDQLRHHPELHASWNLGQLAGLRGLTSLLPLVAVWGAAALLCQIPARRRV